jgi:hypothetical protein
MSIQILAYECSTLKKNYSHKLATGGEVIKVINCVVYQISGMPLSNKKE